MNTPSISSTQKRYLRQVVVPTERSLIEGGFAGREGVTQKTPFLVVDILQAASQPDMGGLSRFIFTVKKLGCRPNEAEEFSVYGNDVSLVDDVHQVAKVDLGFVDAMQFEIRANTPIKGDLDMWQPTRLSALAELQHHTSKLAEALIMREHSSNQTEKENADAYVRELSADVAIIAMKIWTTHK